jgi:ubiquinone/menaquinone biosynthesis C-methylase UbiE
MQRLLDDTFKKHFLRHAVQDLGGLDRRLEGIFSPGYSADELAQHIHSVFGDDVERFLSFTKVDRPTIEHWKDLFRQALGPILADISRVLDIGSGNGITVCTLAEVLPTGTIIASDLSLPLLIELKHHVEGKPNVVIFQANAENLIFSDGAFDMVSGAHVLHHMTSLETAFAEIKRVLRPGGVAVFWEPIEDGAQLIAFLYELWLEMDLSRADHLTDAQKAAMRGFLFDLRQRVGREKSFEKLRQLDDKWWFTRQHLRELAAEAGFRNCEIKNVYKPRNVLSALTTHELKRWGQDIAELPAWATDRLKEVQERLSLDYLDEHPFSSAIVLQS